MNQEKVPEQKIDIDKAINEPFTRAIENAKAMKAQSILVAVVLTKTDGQMGCNSYVGGNSREVIQGMCELLGKLLPQDFQVLQEYMRIAPEFAAQRNLTSVSTTSTMVN